MPKLTAMMIVRNEADRYLRRCLESLHTFVDDIVILDDASDDDTPEICLSYPCVKLYRQPHSMFLTDEAEMRRKLWHYTMENKAEWILAIDADEFLEESFLKEVPYLLNQNKFRAIGFRLFDCWGDEDHYRIDGLWNPWLRGFSIYLIKCQPQLASDWPALKFHCGRLPLAYRRLVHYESAIRIKHLGWANPLDIKAKYERAVRQDPDNNYMKREHYESILWSPEKIITEKWL
ncbi:glycosyltransferase family 2 protein [Desulfosporosinus sp. SYSU MS00001]|uniref:glycosyltransferase family 2 protein n=1 Tax=Desulfosporosinus sp. SYSU MS00001 TaxID=3416284 RepID=UPI003CF57760